MLLCALLSGCGDRLRQPAVLTAPYGEARVWAVAPFANESGVSTVATDRVADLFTEEAQQVHGLDTIPVNRVIRAMRTQNLSSIQTAAEASALISVLGVDGLLVGTVTAYDPYRPPRLGLAVQLYTQPRSSYDAGLDARDFTRSTTGNVSAADFGPPRVVSQSAGVFDASNHETLARLAAYADGRSEPGGAYGADVYLVDMELYTQFVSHQLIYDLLRTEEVRLSSAATDKTTR
jgi:hypothetical protein